MSFFLNTFKIKRPNVSIEGLFSQRSLRIVIIGGIVCIVFVFFGVCQPAYIKLHSLQEDRMYWEKILTAGVEKTDFPFPSKDRLPELVDKCRNVLRSQGINVLFLNVEDFGDRQTVKKEMRIDYASVRFKVQGQWQEILLALQKLENQQDVSVRVQEVRLNEREGEVLMYIYICL